MVDTPQSGFRSTKPGGPPPESDGIQEIWATLTVERHPRQRRYPTFFIFVVLFSKQKGGKSTAPFRIKLVFSCSGGELKHPIFIYFFFWLSAFTPCFKRNIWMTIQLTLSKRRTSDRSIFFIQTLGSVCNWAQFVCVFSLRGLWCRILLDFNRNS